MSETCNRRTSGPVKVLLPHRIFGNVYVQELGRAYRDLGCEVIYGPENFYESNYDPDIVHVHWPEDLYRGYGSGSLEVRAKCLFDELRTFKDKGARIAWTVHNEKPHESSDVCSQVYQDLVDVADIIHHHCDCSREKLEVRYKIPADALQYVAPHGHYFTYPNDVSRDVARRRLGLDPDAFVYLHFGAIRRYKGIDRVVRAFRRIRRRGDVLLVAGRNSDAGSLGRRLRFAYYRLVSSSLRFHLRMIDSDEIQLFLNASDAMVLGHKDGLNSGVAILGMSFGLPVVGPRLGCIPSALDLGRNLTYQPGDVSSLADQMAAVRTFDAAETSKQNRAIAAKWNWTDIARPVLDHLAPGTS